MTIPAPAFQFQQPVAAIVMLAVALFAPVAAGSDSRVPAVAGPSIALDFSEPFIERWSAAQTIDIQRAVVPRLEVSGGEWAEDSELWQQAVLLGPLSRDEPKTEFRAFYNDDGLFIRARNEFDPQNAPRGTKGERDRIFWDEDEVVEIRLQAPADEDEPGVLYHFAVTDGGTLYDARTENAAYDADWQVEMGRDANSWTAWIQIPFAAIEQKGPVPILEMNIGRYGPRVEALSWGPSWRRTAERRIVFEGVRAPRRSGAERVDAGRRDPAAPVKSIRSGDGIALDWVTGVARPQDRWVEGRVILDPDILLPGDEVWVSLSAPGGDEPLESLRLQPERATGTLKVDLRRWGLGAAKVVVRLMRGDQQLGVAESFLEAEPLPAEFEPGARIPLLVNIPQGPVAGDLWPLYIGVPFKAGQLWQADGWQVEDAAGNSYPTQLEVSTLWALQGAIQWLRVDTVADPGQQLFLVYRPDSPPPEVANPVRLEERDGRIVLSNGRVSYELSAEGSPIAAIRQRGTLVASADQTRGLYLIDQLGRLATASGRDADVRIEAAGPVAAAVRIEGDYRLASGKGGAEGDDEAVARHITRVELFADMPFARVTHTLVLSRDTREVWFQEVGWEFDLAEGSDPEAMFATSRSDSSLIERIVPGVGDGSVSILQEEYFRFSSGQNQFRLFNGDDTVLTGEEMGDWFMLRNDTAGLLISCRESARQQPKEFQVSGDRRMVLKLFSPRAGEQLDFRTDALVERWNLQQLAERRLTPEQAALYVEEVKGLPSNAIGWAKTHEILFSPAASADKPEDIAAVAWWHSHPVFVLSDPAWLYHSGAMGPLHPRDPERFPEAEQRIDAAIENFAARAAGDGFRGFVDYEAGPPFGYGRFFRWGLTYSLRPDAWRVFARSGQRQAYNFATKTNRAWGDNYLASWGDGDKTKGLYTSNVRTTEAPGLPFYWGTHTETNIRSSTNLNQLIWDYTLTGYRRAGDQVRDFAEGIKEQVTPASIEVDRRILTTFRTLVQCYGFTWDDDLRQLAEALADSFEDREGVVGLTKNRPLASSTYKTNVDFRALLEAWQLLGHPRYHWMSSQLADYLWGVEVGSEPISYVNPLGVVGNFLYDETLDPMVAQALLVHMRWANAELGSSPSGLSPHVVTFLFEGFPAIQDVVVRSDADRQSAAAWAGARHYQDAVSFAFHKGDRDTLTLSLKTPAGIGQASPVINALNPGRGIDLTSGGFLQRDYTTWSVPVDAPEGPFEVTPAPQDGAATHLGFLSGPQPMILHAPGYWMPFPQQVPAVRWYFNLPPDASNGSIFFEGRAVLYTPDNEVWAESGEASEWIQLPDDKPGLWAFAPLSPGMVRVKNLPPFFAAEHATFWFDPGIEWVAQEADDSDPEIMPETSGFVAGVSKSGDDRALYISPSGSFTIPGGEDLGDGRGREFLPFRQGTIEFWMRPEWGSFTLTGDSLTIFQMPAPGRRWDLTFNLETSHYTHALYAYAIGEDENGNRRSFRSWRGYTIFEPGEWVHVAITWGQGASPNPRYGDGLTFAIYVDGKPGTQLHFDGTRGNNPADLPERLIFPNLNATIDQLHISDVIRYHGEFDPPSSGDQPELDDHTRAWFPFDGTLEGVSGSGDTVQGLLKP